MNANPYAQPWDFVVSFPERRPDPFARPSRPITTLVIVTAGHGLAIRYPTLRLDLLHAELAAIAADQHGPLSRHAAARIFTSVSVATHEALARDHVRRLGA